MNSPAMLLDVTRLVWRVWRGRQPTGIDRVCLAYVEAYEPSSLAVVQRRGLRLIFDRRASNVLYRLFREGGPQSRQGLVRFFLRHGPAAALRQPVPRQIYVNVGHTGLDDDGLVRWIAHRQLRAVYLVHDLIPITHPETCRPGERDRHCLRMRNALLSASGIIGNSQATLDELSAFAAGQALAMPPALPAWIAGKPVGTASPSWAGEQPYFLVLGTIERRKNHELLLRAWDRLVAELGASAPKLVIVGGRGWQAEDVVRRLDNLGDLTGFVEERRNCSDRELTDLIANARALLMPSRAEGYGLPVFEAMELGTPVIATDLAVYREVVGSLPTYLGPDDVEGWVVAVRDFLAEGLEWRRQRRALATFAAPDWLAHFAKVNPWLQSLPERQ